MKTTLIVSIYLIKCIERLYIKGSREVIRCLKVLFSKFDYLKQIRFWLNNKKYLKIFFRHLKQYFLNKSTLHFEPG